MAGVLLFAQTPYIMPVGLTPVSDQKVDTIPIQNAEAETVFFAPRDKVINKGSYIVKFVPRETQIFDAYDKTTATPETYFSQLKSKPTVFSTQDETIEESVTIMETFMDAYEVNAIEPLFDELITTNSASADQLRNIYTITVDGEHSDEAVLNYFNNSDAVVYAEHDLLMYVNGVNDPYATPSYMWYLTTTQAYEARDAGAIGKNEPNRDKDVVIAVVDNAFDPSHPDLKDNIVGMYDASDGDENVSPPASSNGGKGGAWYHGTHVAGSAAASTNNALGVAAISHNV